MNFKILSRQDLTDERWQVVSRHPTYDCMLDAMCKIMDRAAIAYIDDGSIFVRASDDSPMRQYRTDGAP